MKKILAVVVVLAGICAGVGLAGGQGDLLEGGKRALAQLGIGDEAPTAPSAPVAEVAPSGSAGSTAAPARARIQRVPDGPPRERLTEEDRARLDQLIGDSMHDTRR